jgi:hypothetical protein
MRTGVSFSRWAGPTARGQGMRVKTRGIIPFLCVAAGVSRLWAQVGPGDVAVVAYSADAPDGFAWVALADVPANTVLNFTDSSVSNGWFYWAEHLLSGPQALGQGGPLTWSCANDLPRGTVVSFRSDATNWSLGTVGGHYPRLSASGDQLFIYTNAIVRNAALPGGYEGDASGATMLFGVNFGNAGWTNGGGTSYSAVPVGLATGNLTAVHTDARDNGYYRGAGTGTVAELRRALADPGNWTTSDAPQDSACWPARFEILPETTLFEFSRRDGARRAGGT